MKPCDMATMPFELLHSHLCESIAQLWARQVRSHPCCSQETLPCPKELGCHFFHLLRRSFTQNRTVHLKKSLSHSSTRSSTDIATAASIQPKDLVCIFTHTTHLRATKAAKIRPVLKAVVLCPFISEPAYGLRTESWIRVSGPETVSNLSTQS